MILLAGLLVLAALRGFPAHCQPCFPDVDTPGVTIPRGDIVLEYGNKLEIYCIIDTSHRLSKVRDASHLRFYRNQKLVEKDKVKVLNTTTAKLTEKPDPSRSVYVCKLERNAHDELLVCANVVVVGYRPQPVDNFVCTSDNWMNLNCSWKERENPIATDYKLSFHLTGRSGGRNQFVCPDNTERLHYCHWSRTTTPKYRTEYEYYYFQFTGTNVLGESVFPKIQFHHYAHVIPSKPYRFTYKNVTANSVHLEWDLHHHIKHFPPGFNYKIQYKPLCGSLEEWKTANTSVLPNKIFSFDLTDLEYSNAVYEVRLFIQSRVAAVEGMWSQPASLKFKTMPDVPKFPPRTEEGSFQVIKKQHHRDIIVYWQQITKCAENGDGFNYKIISVEEDGERKDVKPEYIGMSYAYFKKLTYKSYNFEIVSENNIGYSKDKSILFVPSEIKRPPEPTGLTKHVTEDETVHIFWNTVSDSTWSNKIHSYTLFWCQNVDGEPNHCSGMLNWTYSHENSSHMELSVIQGKSNDFAISANSYSGSSGMIWVMCNLRSEDGWPFWVTYEYNIRKYVSFIWRKPVSVVLTPSVLRMTTTLNWFLPELIKVNTFHANALSSTSIEVRFHLDCVNNLQDSIFYAIFYCPVASSADSTCEAPQNKMVLSNTGEIITLITELLPYTTYVIYIIPVVINDGEISKYGEASDRIYCRTFESAPSPPETVSLFDVTNQSLVAKWKPPLHVNGILQHYIVQFNGKSITTASVEQLEVKLEDLESFTQYEVSVSACTIACSNFTIPVKTTTGIGVPGAIHKISASMKEPSLIEVKWEPPKYKGGYLDFYELKVISVNTQNSSTIQHFNSSNLEYTIPVPDCYHISISYSLAIRAVNKNESNYTFYGPWSDTKDILCKAITMKSSMTGQTQRVHVAIWPVSALILALFLFCILTLIRRCVRWLISAKKIEVKLPPGLEPCHGGDKDDHTDVTWLLKVNNVHLAQNVQAVTDNEILMQLDGYWPENHSGHGDGELYAAMAIDMPSNCGNELEQGVSVSQVLVANVSLEEVSVLGYCRTNQIRRDDISGHMSVTTSTQRPSETKDNTSCQSDWSLADFIVTENISVGSVHSDSYYLNDHKQKQQEKTGNSYVGISCKPETSLSFSDLSSLSSVSYNLPEHRPLLKNFINKQSSLVSLSNQCSHSESELFESAIHIRQIEKDISEESENISVEDIYSENFCFQSLEQTQQQNSENNYIGLMSKPHISVSLSDLSSLTSVSCNLSGHSSFLQNFITSENSQDSLTTKSLYSECELFSDVLQQETAEHRINEEREKEELVKTRTIVKSSVNTSTAVNHVPDSYCRIGVYSTTSTVQDKCEADQQENYEVLKPVDLKYEANFINLQNESEFSDICTNEDACSVLSDIDSLEHFTDTVNAEHKTVMSNHYVATNPTVIATNTG